EALVIPTRAAEVILRQPAGHAAERGAASTGQRVASRAPERIDRASQDLRHAMSTHVGIVRDRGGMHCALRTIAHCERVMAPLWVRKRMSMDLFTLRDLTAVARAITEAALAEPVSVGAHFRVDP